MTRIFQATSGWPAKRYRSDGTGCPPAQSSILTLRAKVVVRSGSTGMKAGGWGKGRIQLLWVAIALICAAASVAGFILFGSASDHWLAFIQAFAAGAILLMIANSMITRAYKHGGKLAVLFTVLGFFISVAVVVLGHFPG